MATVLDFSVLSSLSIVFVFVAIFVGAWGLLMMLNPFNFDEKKKNVYSVLAFALAFIFILSRPVVSVISFSIPWFAVLVIITFFMLFFTKMIDPGFDTAALPKEPVVYGFLIAFTVIIVLFGMAATFGQDLLEAQPGVSDADVIRGETRPTDTFVPVDEDPAVVAERQITTGGIPVNGAVTPTASSNIGSNIILTLFHPKILGMLFMMVLATMTILLIGR